MNRNGRREAATCDDENAPLIASEGPTARTISAPGNARGQESAKWKALKGRPNPFGLLLAFAFVVLRIIADGIITLSPLVGA